MPQREQMGTDFEPTFVQRVAAGVKYAIAGVTPTDWFGPWQPLTPQAQDKTEGRAFDYPVGYNLRILPRSDEAISFGQLRNLADGYDLLRLVLETRKDQIEAFEWEIVPVSDDINADGKKDSIKNITQFFQKPDKEHDWPEWLRMQTEDCMVLDAIAVYPRMSRGGELYGFELIDPATIKRVLDVSGRTPLAPSPAYQQILKGIPAADYSTEDLIYKIRNPRTNRVYGYSPVEQIIMTVSIAIRRQMSQLDFYTAGNVPEAIAQVPETWSPKQIQDFQLFWDSLMEGNTANRRKMRFIPMLKDIVFPKKDVLKDEFDEWLARIVAFAFSISPSALIKQVNRASGEQMADTAKEEGLLPFLRFFANHFTAMVRLIDPELKFQWKLQNKIDPKAQAEIHGIYIDKKVITPDEARQDLGKTPMTSEEREAAFPAPPTPGFDEDGRPLAPEVPVGEEPKATALALEEKKPAEKTASEKALEEVTKLLAACIEKLDPALQGAILEKLVKAQPPTVVELKPEVNVDVGETTVHAHIARQDFNKTVVTERRADGTVVATVTNKKD